MPCRLSLLLPVLLALNLFLPFQAVRGALILDGSATFSPGVGNDTGDNFSIVNNSSAGIQLSKVVIDLTGSPNGLFFDTAGGTMANPSSPLALGAPPTGGTVVNLPAVADGATSLTLEFTGFDPGESFSFTIDVDRAGNKNVTQGQFAGATIEFFFTGPFIDSPTSISGAYAQSGNVATTQVNGEVQPLEDNGNNVVPEPATLAIWSLLGLVGAGSAAGRRWKARRAQG